MRVESLMYAIFFCPSLKYILIVITSSSASTVMLAGSFNSIDKQESVRLILECPLYAIIAFVVYHLLQKRELKNFYRERKAIRMHGQVMDVFHSQSDAIVAIKKNHNEEDNKSQELEVLFCNQQSVNLFDCDL